MRAAGVLPANQHCVCVCVLGDGCVGLIKRLIFGSVCVCVKPVTVSLTNTAY